MSYDSSNKQTAQNKWSGAYFDNDGPPPFPPCQFSQNDIQERARERRLLSQQYQHWEQGNVGVPPLLDSYGAPISALTPFNPSYFNNCSHGFNYTSPTLPESQSSMQFSCMCSGNVITKHFCRSLDTIRRLVLKYKIMYIKFYISRL